MNAFDLIDTYGSRLKRWPEDARAAFETERTSNPAVDAYMKDARRLDKQLSDWEENEDGVDIDDDESEGPSSGPQGDGDGDESEGEPNGPSDGGEDLADLAAALMAGDIPDLNKELAGFISAMAKKEFSDDPYVEYTSDLDKIERVKVDPRADVEGVQSKVNAVSAVVQKDLQRLITARSLSVMQPGLRRGRINPSSLHRLETGDDRVFRRKIENQSKDVAVSLLVDCSGSMAGDTFRTAMEAAWCFAEVLDRLNIKCEVLGFTTRTDYDCYGPEYGRLYREEVSKFAKRIGKAPSAVRWEALHIPIFKEYGEKFGLEQKRRMATGYSSAWQSSNLCQNLDGASVLVAAKRLIARPEKRKLLIVFSDGAPCASMDSSILRKHLKETVKQVEGFGIETVGVGIRDDSVKAFYPKHFVVNNVSDLPKKVVGELKRFLTS